MATLAKYLNLTPPPDSDFEISEGEDCLSFNYFFQYKNKLKFGPHFYFVFTYIMFFVVKINMRF